MRNIIAALMGGTLLVFGVACDDNEKAAPTGKIDEDDTRVGPGDGQDEVGPGR